LPKSFCDDPFDGSAMGGVTNYTTSDHPRPDWPSVGSNAARMGVAAAVAYAKSLSAGTEYYAFRLSLQYESSSGVGACEGCNTPVCLTLSEVAVYDDSPEPSGNELTHQPDPEIITQQAQNRMISWQDSGANCQPAVKNKTWGQLKSLYR